MFISTKLHYNTYLVALRINTQECFLGDTAKKKKKKKKKNMHYYW